MAAYEPRRIATATIRSLQAELVFHQRSEAYYCETGTVQAKPHGGGAVAKLGKEQLSIVEALVMAQPDALLKNCANALPNKPG